MNLENIIKFTFSHSPVRSDGNGAAPGNYLSVIFSGGDLFPARLERDLFIFATLNPPLHQARGVLVITSVMTYAACEDVPRNAHKCLPLRNKWTSVKSIKFHKYISTSWCVQNKKEIYLLCKYSQIRQNVNKFRISHQNHFVWYPWTQ